jgi:RimK family alpha-L-glutamate ligase
MKAKIVGNPIDDPSGVLLQKSFEKRGFAVSWISMTAFMEQLLVDGETLLQIASRDPEARTFVPESIVVSLGFVAQSDVVIVVSDEFGCFQHAVVVALHNAGILTANHPSAVKRVADKWQTDESLRDAGIAVPLSRLVSDFDAAKSAAAELLYPVVLKRLMGTKGEGVLLANDEHELQLCAAKLGLAERPLIIQQYVECGASDIRMLCVDGRFLAGILRTAVAPGEFRSNTALGGSVQKIEVTKEQAAFGSNAARALGLRFGGLDVGVVTEILPGREYLKVGQPFCIEANAQPALYSYPETHGADFAEDLVESMIIDLDGRRRSAS